MPEPEASGTGLLSAIAGNLRRLRRQRGMSMADAARLGGLSLQTLAEIEDGEVVPPIDVLWKLASVLEVPFGAMLGEGLGSRTTVMRRAEADALVSSRGQFTSRALFPLNGEARAEFYELRLAPGAIERSAAHPPGTTENLVVVSGSAAIEVDDSTHLLSEGDALFFHADTLHSYQNAGPAGLILHLVMTYSSTAY